MTVKIRIPTTLRPLTGGESEVEVEATTVAEAFTALEAAHPGFHERLYDEQGILRRFVNVFVADDDVRYLDGAATAVPEGETISIIETTRSPVTWRTTIWLLRRGVMPPIIRAVWPVFGLDCVSVSVPPPVVESGSESPCSVKTSGPNPAATCSGRA